MISFTVLILSHGQEELLRRSLESLNFLGDGGEVLIHKSGEALALDELRQREWVFFLEEGVSFHSSYADVLEASLKLPKLDVLGGPLLISQSMGPRDRSVMIALSSPFCSGITVARYKSLGKKLIAADEEKLSGRNLWVRSSLLSAGLLSEWPRTSWDTLLLQQLKSQGHGLYYHPRLMAYVSRAPTLLELYESGRGRSRILRKKLSSGGEVFWIPAIFVLLHALALLSWESFLMMVQLYAGIIVFVSLGLCMRRGRPWLFPAVALLHYLIVLSHGVGFIAERLNLKRSL